MTWDSFIGMVEDVLTLTALATVTYAGMEFIRGVWSAREAKRTSQVSAWRKVSVQRLVSKSEAFMTAAEITAALRSSSFDAPFDIKKDELNEESVRALLLELISERILGQVWPDSYGIVQLPRDVTLAAAVAGVKGNFAVRSSFALIHEHPGHYTDDALYQKLKENLGLSYSDFVLAISDLDTRNVAKRGGDGKWSPVVNRIEGQK